MGDDGKKGPKGEPGPMVGVMPRMVGSFVFESTDWRIRESACLDCQVMVRVRTRQADGNECKKVLIAIWFKPFTL